MAKMALRMIAYDLGGPEDSDSYRELINAIKSLGSWCKPEFSLWLVETSTSPERIRGDLKPYLDKNDRIVVTEVVGQIAWEGLKPEVVEWIRQHHR